MISDPAGPTPDKFQFALDEANAAQAEHWNSPVGDTWREMQPEIDQRMRDLTTLLFERADVVVGERVLDVGCGPGSTTLHLAELVGEAGHVLGLDLSAAVLEGGRARAKAAGHGNITFEQADAQARKFDVADRDLLFSRFGVMFFADPQGAFGNLLTALKPGGRLTFVCWAGREHNPFFRVPSEIAAQHLGPIERPPPRAPGPMAFAEADYIQDFLGTAGFVDIEISSEDIPLIGQPTTEAEAMMATRMGPLRSLFRERQASEQQVKAVLSDLAKALSVFLTPQGVRIPARFNYVNARRP